jgi:HEAT repeat protein
MARTWMAAALLAALVAAGCEGGAEEQTTATSARISVKWDKYDPIHTGVTRSLNPEVVKAKIQDLAGINEVRRDQALNDLVVMGRREPKVLGLLARELGNSDPFVRQYCLIAIGRIGGDPAEMPADDFLKLMDDPDDGVKCGALYATGMTKVRNKDLAKKAFYLLNHPKPEVRTHAAECIRRIQFWPAIPALIYGHLALEKPEALSEETFLQFRIFACEALENITLERVMARPAEMDIDSVLIARAKAWVSWWESNRYRYGG